MPLPSCVRRWKNRGLIHNDYKELYETYINTSHCNHCKKEFKNSLDRCMDHDHETGMFRNIICRACNNSDTYIKYPNGYDPTEYRKQYWKEHKEDMNSKNKEYYKKNKENLLQSQQDYRDKNKEKIKEYNKLYKQENKEKIKKRNSDYDKKKFTCGCGSVISNGNKYDHNKTLKHMDWWINSLD